MNLPELRRLLIELRVAYDDGDAVTEDALRSPRKRELGPVLQKRNYRQARRKVIALHAEVMRRIDAEPEGSPVAPH